VFLVGPRPSEFLCDAADRKFSLEIGILIMRIYALYERSRKVLALYIVVAVITFAVSFVSLNFSGNEYPA
jgi:hypothetical protein